MAWDFWTKGYWPEGWWPQGYWPGQLEESVIGAMQATLPDFVAVFTGTYPVAGMEPEVGWWWQGWWDEYLKPRKRTSATPVAAPVPKLVEAYTEACFTPFTVAFTGTFTRPPVQLHFKGFVAVNPVHVSMCSVLPFPIGEFIGAVGSRGVVQSYLPQFMARLDGRWEVCSDDDMVQLVLIAQQYECEQYNG